MQGIPPELFNQRYKFISFDLTSLFTNVPLKRTVNIIAKLICFDKVVSTTLRKRITKKLTLDACAKTKFSFLVLIASFINKLVEYPGVQ